LNTYFVSTTEVVKIFIKSAQWLGRARAVTF